MMKTQERDYPEYEGDDDILDSEDMTDAEIEFDDEKEGLLNSRAETIRFRRTWRDTEKYREIRELYRIVNDELYTGFSPDEFFENEKNK